MAQEGKRRFRPSRWALVTVLVAVPLLLGLGMWQVQRLVWKTAMIERVEAGLAQVPTDLPFTIHVPEAFDYTPVRVEGRYLDAGQLVLTSRVREGTPGARLMAGFMTTLGDRIVVDRGWVPDMQPDPAAWPVPEGVRQLTGVLRVGGEPGWFAPDNDGADGLWFWRDLPAMAEALGLHRAVPLMLVVESDRPIGEDRPDPAAMPVTDRVEADFRNEHLNYALTWFSLAVALVVIFVLHGYRRAP